MATTQSFLCFSLFFILTIICLSDAYRFNVGGKDGWVFNPTENYDHWAQRMRFSVNDTLYFKYKNGSDSVLVVNKDDYDKCNTLNPILKLEGGDSEFKFDRSGPFYFITGNMGNCNKGQKLIVVVLAVRNPPHPPSSPVPSPSAITPAPTGSTPVPSPASELSPMSPTPATETPVPAPVTTVSPSPTPELSPVSPSPENGPPSPPVSSPPSQQPPTSPSNSPPGGTVPTTGNTPPGGANSTAPAGSSANSFTPSVVLLSWVLFVSSVVLHGSFN